MRRESSPFVILLVALTFLVVPVFQGCDEGSGKDEICDNGVDDDGDGAIDCQDIDCAGQWGNSSGALCQVVERDCDDGFDNDGDGDVDCDDPDCVASGACGDVEICDDGTDNDGDGATDCQDTDCAEAPECEGVEVCGDGTDNDGDGLADCADDECVGVVVGAGGVKCEQPETTCGDGFDNDGDGDVDCDDPDCSDAPGCGGGTELCENFQDDDGDGLVDCADPDCEGHKNFAGKECEIPETTCDDNFDNDGDGKKDCADEDCANDPACAPAEDCADGTDNDGDGLMDCADPDCAGQQGDGGTCEQPESSCDDNFDNDGDGDVDCDDADCSGAPECQSTQEICNDWLDNDGDGLTDCADPDCASQQGDGGACEATESRCSDGFDNDGDGLTDCADPDCGTAGACQNHTENPLGAETDCHDGTDNDGDNQTDCNDYGCCLTDASCMAMPQCMPFNGGLLLWQNNGSDVPVAWAERHPDDITRDATGPSSPAGRLARPVDSDPMTEVCTPFMRIENSTQYTVSVDVYNESANLTGEVLVRFYRSDFVEGSSSVSLFDVASQAVSGWTTMTSQPFSAPAPIDRIRVCFRTRRSGGSSAGYWYIDSVSVSRN